MAHYPAGYCLSLLAMMEHFTPPAHVVCCLSEAMPEGLKSLLFRSGAQAVIKTAGNAGELGRIAPFTQGYDIPEGGERYYLCQGGSCRAPVSTLEGLEKALQQ